MLKPANPSAPTASRWSRALPATLWWIAVPILAVVVWGVTDPLALRARLDAAVLDHFLSHRVPPPMHADILQVSMDDLAARQLGITDRRHRLARAIRQLHRLGARTVLVDVLFLDHGSRNSFHEEEAGYDGIPPESIAQNPPLQSQYEEDRLLAKALGGLPRVVIPFQLELKLRGDDALSDADKSTIDSLARQLESTPELSNKLNHQSSQRFFGPALEMAAERLATHPDRAAAVLTGPQSPLTDRLERAVDRQQVIQLIESTGSFEIGNRTARELTLLTANQSQVPPLQIASAAKLGFLDIHAVEGGKLRRLPLIGRWGDRVVPHQALLAFALHIGSPVNDMTLEPGRLRVGERVIPIDDQGRLVINWSMNRRRKWNSVIPELSVADLLELARYDDNIQQMRHRVRVNVVLLDAELKIRTDPDDSCHAWLNDLLVKYANGQFEQAEKSAAWFDETLIPEILDHPKVRMLEARTNPGEPPSDDKSNSEPVQAEPTQAAQALTAIRRQLEPIKQAEAERKEAIHRLRKVIDGKLCLVGDTTTGSTDLKLTPVGADIPGVSVIASAINTMLINKYLTPAGLRISVLTTIVAAVLMGLVVQRAHMIVATVSGFGGIAILYFGHLQLLTRMQVLASPLMPMAGVVVCYLTVSTRRWWSDLREKRKIRQAFQLYLHPIVVDRVCRNPELLKLGGEQAELSVLFSDIRGFTSISEQLSPPELVQLLNEYLTEMTRIVFYHGGTLDKYIGDAVMAFYGAPVPVEDHAFEACRTAIEMNERLAQLCEEWQERDLPQLAIGVGINSAQVIVGNMGSEMHFDYTVMGDGVNLASRLEGANKFYGTRILIGEDTWRQVRDRIGIREIDLLQVKGKEQPTRVFEVLGLLPLSTDQEDLRAEFERGLQAFRARQFSDAADCFQKSLEIAGDDGPSRLYLERCTAFRDQPPPDDWNGVFVMQTK